MTDETLTPTDLAVEAVCELRALHWSSLGAGATIPEIAAGLAMRGIDTTVGQVLVALALADVDPDPWQRHPTEPPRGNWPVLVPADPIDKP